MSQPLYVTDQEIESLLDLDELLMAVELSLIAYSSGIAMQPLRTTLPLAAEDSLMFVMPGCWKVGGLKLVTLAPQNAALDLPTHSALILVVSPDTGRPVAILDADHITRMRTAAASGVATRHLASGRPSKLALLGSGVQAQGHLTVMRHLFPDIRTFVWSATSANANTFAERWACTAAATAQEAVEDADIVVTATTAAVPILKGEWLKPGAHVNAVGAPRPAWRELDNVVMRNAIYVDSRSSAMAESGDVIGSGCSIVGEIGELAAGTLSADRSRTTVFKSLGLAVEDLATAHLILVKIGALAPDRAAGH
jgi:ornithine cyclodeaminase/alanine dehydrogenase-like protein (mu-crystallin family)